MQLNQLKTQGGEDKENIWQLFRSSLLEVIAFNIFGLFGAESLSALQLTQLSFKSHIMEFAARTNLGQPNTHSGFFICISHKNLMGNLHALQMMSLSSTSPPVLAN